MSDESDLAATVSYRVGRDHAGRWIAMETAGRSGGMFATREAAIHFARSEASRRPGIVTMATQPVGFV